MSGLKSELEVQEPNYRIVRRRVVWLIGQWSGVKLSPELRPKLYEILLPLLEKNRGEDLVVRLAAAKALKVIIDDFEFSSEELQPFLPTAFNHLFFLLKEVQECDTKVNFPIFESSRSKSFLLFLSSSNSKIDDVKCWDFLKCLQSSLFQ